MTILFRYFRGSFIIDPDSWKPNWVFISDNGITLRDGTFLHVSRYQEPLSTFLFRNYESNIYFYGIEIPEYNKFFSLHDCIIREILYFKDYPANIFASITRQ